MFRVRTCLHNQIALTNKAQFVLSIFQIYCPLTEFSTANFLTQQFIELPFSHMLVYHTFDSQAYMRCVQPDSHKRSTGGLAYSRSQESMVPEERLSNVPHPLLAEEYVSCAACLIRLILCSGDVMANSRLELNIVDRDTTKVEKWDKRKHKMI